MAHEIDLVGELKPQLPVRLGYFAHARPTGGGTAFGRIIPRSILEVANSQWYVRTPDG
jgi:hypothetical protein